MSTTPGAEPVRQQATRELAAADEDQAAVLGVLGTSSFALRGPAAAAVAGPAASASVAWSAS